MAGRWSKGHVITMNSVWEGKLRASWPVRVVLDSPDLLVTYLAPGTQFKHAATALGDFVRMPIGEWQFINVVWTAPTLTFALPGRPYRLLAFQDETHQGIRQWYANLEKPFVRIPDGYDFEDLFLDVVLTGDLSEYRWKDEDELREATRLGLLTPSDAQEVYKAGEEVIKLARANGSPFSDGWGSWKPDPDWQVPLLKSAF